MIKCNIVLDTKIWIKKIKKPDNYFKLKLKKLSKFHFFRKKNHEFTILLTNNNKMKKLNLKFRNKNKITDVLSFPSHQKRILKNLFKKKKEIYIGDIILNFNKIKKNKFKLSFIDMLDKLWIHGFLHLLGYTHKKDSDFKIMLKKEEKYLKAIKSINVK